MFYYSKYNLDFNDGNDVVAINLLSSSIVKFKQDKFKTLKSLQIESNFSKEEIAALLDMGFIVESEDEYGFINKSRLELFKSDVQNGYHITILTTSDCNAKCYYCYEHGINKKHMSLETAYYVGEYIKKNYNGQHVFLNWFGGEPLYNEKVIDYICSSLRDANISYSSSLVTNAYLIDENFDKIINLWNVKRLQITIDAIGDKYNQIKNYIYNTNIDAFNKVVNNIDLLIKHHIKINIRINFHPLKVEEAKEVIKFLYDKFGNSDELFVYCAWLLGDNIPSPMQFNAKNNPLLELYKTLLDCKYITKMEDMGINPRMLNCSIYWKGMSVVDVDGNLYKCQHSIIDGSRSAFGTVYEGITNKVNIDSWENLDYPYSECKECVCLPICQGGCKHRAINDKKENVCIAIKDCILEVIKLFYYKKCKEDASE